MEVDKHQLHYNTRKLGKQIEELTIENVGLKNQLNHSCSIQLALQKDLHSSEQSKRALNNRVSKLQDSVLEMSDEIRALRYTNSVLNDRVQTADIAFDLKWTNISDELLATRLLLKASQTTVAEHEQEISDLTAEVTTLRTTLVSLKQELNICNTQLQVSAHTNLSQQEEIESLQNAFENLYSLHSSNLLKEKESQELIKKLRDAVNSRRGGYGQKPKI